MSGMRMGGGFGGMSSSVGSMNAGKTCVLLKEVIEQKAQFKVSVCYPLEFP
jgi:thymidine kinase